MGDNTFQWSSRSRAGFSNSWPSRTQLGAAERRTVEPRTASQAENQFRQNPKETRKPRRRGWGAVGSPEGRCRESESGSPERRAPRRQSPRGASPLRLDHPDAYGTGISPGPPQRPLRMIASAISMYVFVASSSWAMFTFTVDG